MYTVRQTREYGVYGGIDKKKGGITNSIKIKKGGITIKKGGITNKKGGIVLRTVSRLLSWSPTEILA